MSDSTQSARGGYSNFRCLFCGRDADAQQYVPGEEAKDPLYPDHAEDIVRNWRHNRQNGRLLLHHECQSPRAAIGGQPYWDPETAWWSCKYPNRPADEFMHFDLGCGDCAARWHAVRDQLPPA